MEDKILLDNKISSKAYKAYKYIKYYLSTDQKEMLRDDVMLHSFKEGREAVKGAVKELIEHGYIDKIQIRNSKGNLFSGNEYTILK